MKQRSKVVDTVCPKGAPRIRLFDQFGNLKQEEIASNLVVTAGKVWIAERIDNDTDPADMSHMAVGTGTTSPVVGNTTLETELARVALDSTVVAANTTTFTATFGPGTGTGALTEAGIFNDPTTGSMLARVTFSVVNKGTLDTMVIDWDITIN